MQSTRRLTLRVKVQEQDLLATAGETMCQRDGSGGLSYAAFLVCNRNYSCHEYPY
jgi:hypothetical protein